MNFDSSRRSSFKKMILGGAAVAHWCLSTGKTAKPPTTERQYQSRRMRLDDAITQLG